MNLHIQIPAASTLESDSAFRMPENYYYWTPLAAYYLKQSRLIEIHCWNDEIQAIDELEELGVFKVEAEQNMTIFKGELSVETADFLLNHFLDGEGKFKWFSVFADHFSSEHWATEIIVEAADEKEIARISSVTPAETQIHQFK
ncbi:hypothetical protein [Metabacillus idriensis]|uniref:hypothetical protein n=1 Tax=Metabacillus idriensis TaxID=324768 RepID=UPI003D2790A7